MINEFAYKMIFLALHSWPSAEKARLFERHMECVLHQPELSEQVVNEWAEKFKHFPANIVKNVQSKINKATYQQ